MIIRTATLQDWNDLARVEAICFTETEAASQETIKARLQVYPEHFWILQHEGNIIGFIDGPVVNQPAIVDEMFEHTELHDEMGLYQSVFSLSVLPEYQKHGYGAQLMRALIADAKSAGRVGCILTCKAHLIHYYENFGYENQGISKSKHGGAVWYDMLLKLEK